ncbi:MAG: ABC transporter permease subunit [Candidatus Sumerlaeia bacterium]|nr:ABC transporter permease subunit [Candidatus Sumerlaeia bacterium]
MTPGIDANNMDRQRRVIVPAGNVWFMVGVGVLLVVWWAVSRWSGPLLLASPAETMTTLLHLVWSGGLLEHCGITIVRIAVIILVATTAGALMGLLALKDARAAGLFEPWRRLCATVPPIILVIVVMYWMGMGGGMIVTFGALILWPIMYVNLVESGANYTNDLRETAQVFGLSILTRARHFFIPAIMPGCLTAAVQMTCSAIRVVVLAEALGADRGIGAAIVTSSRNLDIAQMTAWVLVTLILAFLAEFALLGPVRRRVYRWKTT